ncbi:asparagine synthase (glutamine-hydrolyzing) [Candidatus Parcubacteria bacterium]|nr:MAG: asparagine synthase (glutamine-hydrolyzing) [Candidatus Parcubacteria bacterium]
MCGIGGYFGEGNEDVLRVMNKALAHRGPDGEGVWEGEKVGFAHRRLAIIDLSEKAAQPMHRGLLSITFNGEIYNYKELRRDLERTGSSFTSHSDTEVILALFERDGAHAFAQLEGMFALTLYDKRNDTLYLVRDRFGEKPLYYLRDAGTLVFASEPKALFAHPLGRREISPEGLAAYLAYDSAISPLSLWQNIARVPPATYLTCTRKGIEERRYWQPSFKVRSRSIQDSLQEGDLLLKRAVERQLVSDVPLGVFLSGGIDSSLIAAYAKEIAGEVHTFSVGFAEKGYDESPHAQIAAKHLGTIHHESILRADDVRDALPSIIERMDEPIADPALLPLHLLSRFARERVTVALSGDGGDELFLGYPTFLADQIRSRYVHTPRVLRHAISTFANTLPVSHRYMSFDFLLRQFLRGVKEQTPYVHRSWITAFSETEIEEVLSPAYRDAARSVRARDEELFTEANEALPLTRASWWYARTILDLYLTKSDRGSMYASLETRAPFLDRSIAEYAYGLPPNHKLRLGKGKYVLRKLAEQKLPHSIAWRRKHGFGLPVGSWLMHEWKPLLTDTLSESNVRSVGLCDPPTVSRYIEEHLAGTHNHSKKLYSLLVLHLWHEKWVSVV